MHRRISRAVLAAFAFIGVDPGKDGVRDHDRTPRTGTFGNRRERQRET